jgi:hypothetical protein
MFLDKTKQWLTLHPVPCSKIRCYSWQREEEEGARVAEVEVDPVVREEVLVRVAEAAVEAVEVDPVVADKAMREVGLLPPATRLGAVAATILPSKKHRIPLDLLVLVLYLVHV